MDAVHQRLLHFLADSDWSDARIRVAAVEYALAQMTRTEPIEAWIFDDTGFLKQGTHSVGVQRQYTGSAGKITNCQVGVSLVLATRDDQLPADFELYLPRSWTDDPLRRKEARLPDNVVFKTKLELAMAMIDRALEAGLPRGVVLGDAAYGSSSEFRHGLRRRDLHYSMGVDPQTTVYEVGDVLTPGGQRTSVRELAGALKTKGLFREHSWRQGTRRELTASFALRRVYPCSERAHPEAEREGAWLLVEWRQGETEPSNYFLSSLPEETSFEELVRITMQRWRTERAYQDMKGELGLDHYEGRRFRGWHHHISVVLACYAFAVAERHRFFPLRSKDQREATETDARRRRPDFKLPSLPSARTRKPRRKPHTVSLPRGPRPDQVEA